MGEKEFKTSTEYRTNKYHSNTEEKCKIPINMSYPLSSVATKSNSIKDRKLNNELRKERGKSCDDRPFTGSPDRKRFKSPTLFSGQLTEDTL